MCITLSPNQLGQRIDLTRDDTPERFKGERGAEVIRQFQQQRREDRIAAAFAKLREARSTFNAAAHAAATRELFAAMDSAA